MRPEIAYKFCPVCGGNFSKTSETSMKCDTCNYPYYVNPKTGVTIILINDNNEMLLTRRAFDPYKDFLDTPGGFVEVHETAEEALVREIREEIGYELVEFEYFGSYSEEYLYKGVIVDVLSNA
jgi:NAD+ diphosphatase